MPEMDVFKYKATTLNSSVGQAVNLKQATNNSAHNEKLDESMVSSSSAKPVNMTISGTDNQKKLDGTK